MSRPAPRSRADAITLPIIPILRALIAVVTVAVVLAMVIFLWTHRDGLVGRAVMERYIDPKAYQAVFLTTSQVYFGKLTIDGDVYALNEVYYVNQPDQQTPGQLVKRGGELHGPRDPMLISAQQVLQVENLSPDSQVVQAIRLIQSGQVPPPASPPATPQPSPTR